MQKITENKFYFMRHGRTDWNNRQLCQGQIDIPLDDVGREEIKKMVGFISTLSFSKIVTSPLLRAFETAEIIKENALISLEIIDEIKERGWGLLEGASSEEMYKVEEQEEEDSHFVPGRNIEERTVFKSRIIKGINKALEGKTPLIVSHGRVFLVLLEILNLPSVRQIPNGEIAELCVVNGKWQVNFLKINS